MSEYDYGISQAVRFLRLNHGKHYIKPEKAGTNADEMMDLKNTGITARNNFSAFCTSLADQIPNLELINCSNWVNQGQRIMPYFWVELKYAKWRDKPNSISLSIGTKDDSNEYHLSVRVDTRNISSHEEDFGRTARLLDLELLDDMFYQTMDKNNVYSYHSKEDKETLKKRIESGDIKKVEVNFQIDDLERKESDGTLFNTALEYVQKLIPFYEYIMSSISEDEWWPSLSEYVAPVVAAVPFPTFVAADSEATRVPAAAS